MVSSELADLAEIVLGNQHHQRETARHCGLQTEVHKLHRKNPCPKLNINLLPPFDIISSAREVQGAEEHGKQ